MLQNRQEQYPENCQTEGKRHRLMQFLRDARTGQFVLHTTFEPLYEFPDLLKARGPGRRRKRRRIPVQQCRKLPCAKLPVDLANVEDSLIVDFTGYTNRRICGCQRIGKLKTSCSNFFSFLLPVCRRCTELFSWASRALARMFPRSMISALASRTSTS